MTVAALLLFCIFRVRKGGVGSPVSAYRIHKTPPTPHHFHEKSPEPAQGRKHFLGLLSDPEWKQQGNWCKSLSSGPGAPGTLALTPDRLLAPPGATPGAVGCGAASLGTPDASSTPSLP